MMQIDAHFGKGIAQTKTKLIDFFGKNYEKHHFNPFKLYWFKRIYKRIHANEYLSN